MRFTRANIVHFILLIIVASSRCELRAQGAEVDGLNYATAVSDHSSKSTGQIRSGYHQIWPEMKLGWRIVVGTIITIISAALGSIGGAGGDGPFVPMLVVIIGFDQKSAVALSKCMILGGAATTVLYNLRQRHEESPVIDYNLALLFNPLMILGTSIGVLLNVLLATWMLTILLIIILLVASIKSFLKGMKTWKKETLLIRKEMAAQIQPVTESPNIGTTNDHQAIEINSSSIQAQPMDQPRRTKVSLLENVHWKELGIIFVLWVVVLVLQLAKTSVKACSLGYWLLEYSQMPVTIGVSLYQAVRLYKGHKVIAFKGDATKYQIRKLITCCAFGILAGIFSGMLGVGGGVMLSPLFLHLGVPPQVSSATATLIMVFSSSMTVVEYRLLKRFPVPYALFFGAFSAVSAILGQAVIGKMISRSGRRSVIIFILAFLMVLSIVGIGGFGIARSIKAIQRGGYMGFEDICSYRTGSLF